MNCSILNHINNSNLFLSQSGSKSTIVNMLLTEMDGFVAHSGIYLIAATNLPSLIDAAALRPGRFDRKIYVGLPGVEDKVSIMKAILGVRRIDSGRRFYC